jgi:hypothetical protein
MADAVAQRDEATGRFLAGNTASPGRKRGARVILSEMFLADCLSEWETHGAAAISDMREKSPGDFVKMVASLVPKEMTLNLNNDLGELSDDELLDEIRRLHASLAPFLAEGIGAQEGAGQPAQLH